MNKKTVPVTEEQYKEIIQTMKSGGSGFRANNMIATALMMEANLGMRIEDILRLRLSDIVRINGKYRLNDIREQKTKKVRSFMVPLEIYEYLFNYCQDYGIKRDERIFPTTERNVQKYLKKVVDYLGYKDSIGTHSFRKFFATQIYENNNYDIVLVQKLLQHDSVSTTQRYLGYEKEVEDALQSHVMLM